MSTETTLPYLELGELLITGRHNTKLILNQKKRKDLNRES